MEYTTLGTTGMSVSEICLGCMSFGSSDWREWVLGEEESKEIIDRSIDLGINFFDTANVYSTGESERVLGNALEGYDRDAMVVATKVYGEMDPDNPNAQACPERPSSRNSTLHWSDWGWTPSTSIRSIGGITTRRST